MAHFRYQMSILLVERAGRITLPSVYRSGVTSDGLMLVKMLRRGSDPYLIAYDYEFGCTLVQNLKTEAKRDNDINKSNNLRKLQENTSYLALDTKLRGTLSEEISRFLLVDRNEGGELQAISFGDYLEIYPSSKYQQPSGLLEEEIDMVTLTTTTQVSP